MSDYTLERKLELVRSMKEADFQNRSSLKKQQSILYGEPLQDMEQPSGSALGLRILTAVILLSLYIVADSMALEETFFSRYTLKLQETITENNLLNGIAFIEEIKYTLNDLLTTADEK
jgi:hypothetical protein